MTRMVAVMTARMLMMTTTGFICTVNSLDTDFPFAVLGLFGGLPWLLIYIALFVGFAVVLYDLGRRQARLQSAQGASCQSKTP